MTPEQFKIVKALFDIVCDLPVDARVAALRKRTDDHEVIEEVLQLAGQTSIRATRFSTPIMNAMGAFVGDELKPGDKLGAWTLQKELGHGGMGAVYLARRSDGHFEQTAAIKLIYGVPSAAALEYLARERQILADLSHPNIARLIDGGATPMGQPYLVMEHIDGVPINRYITDNKLASNQVLVLFKQTFAAVSFAHEQLVVHCDLKPSNILVTQSGRPYLLDFGIAKLIDSAGIVDAFSNRSSAGSSAALAYTPHYASPEQRDGAPVSTKTDVYALGVMLRDSIANQSDDLGAIIAKATASRREQRYESVAALSEDVDRYLANEPVSAREVTAAYRAQKFVQRQWPWVLVWAVFAATVVVFTMRLVSERDRSQTAERTALIERDATRVARAEAVLERDQAVSARSAAETERDRAAKAEANAALQRNLALRERDRAQTSEGLAVFERNRAQQAEAASRQTSDFLVSIFNNSNPTAESGDIPASKLIAAAEARLDSEMHGQPATQADLYVSLGAVNANMGSHAQARKNFQRAIEIERKLTRPLVLADVLSRLSRTDASYFGGKEAVALASEAVALCERYARANSVELAAAFRALGYAKERVGDPAEAVPYMQRALAIEEKNDPASASTATALVALGSTLNTLRQFDKAVANFRRALEIRKMLFGAEDLSVLFIYEGLGLAQGGLKQYGEAEATWRRVLSARRKLHGEFNARYTTYYLILSGLMTDTGRLPEAMQFARLALENADKTVGRQNSGYLVSLNNAALIQDVLGNEAEAIRLMQEVVAAYPKVHPAAHTVPARYERNIGRMLNYVGRPDEAIPHLLTSLEIYQRIYGEKHRSVANALLELAKAYAHANKLDEARARFEQYLLQLPQPEVDTRANEVETRAIIAAKQGNLSEALQRYLDMERLTLEMLNSKDIRYLVSMLPRAELLAARNQGDDRAKSRMLASEMMNSVGEILASDAPVLARIKRLQMQ